MCKSPGSLWRSTRGHVVSIPGLYAFTRPSLSLSFLFSLSLFRSISSKAGFKLHATSAGSCRCKRNRKEMPRLDNRGTGKHKRGKKYRSTIHHEFRPTLTFLRFQVSGGEKDRCARSCCSKHPESEPLTENCLENSDRLDRILSIEY